MSPAEEDALVEKYAADCFDNPNCDDVRESFRLAIRAAVAQERERAAKVCEEVGDEYQEREGRQWAELKTDAQTGAWACAAAIRRGDEAR